MARSRRTTGSKGSTRVENLRHDDKRVNIPTADAQEFAAPDVRRAALARDGSLDPQLIWRGKYPDDVPGDDELVTDAPPIYIQEKIDPRALVEDLRRHASTGQDGPEATLFDDWDGLNEIDSIDFYRHPANWANRMILGDSLQVMSSLAERESLRGAVQMVYIDPPYGIKFGSNWQVSARRRDVKDGKLEDAAREAEQVKAFRDTWELGIHSYLSYLRDRLLVTRDLLTESGSCFVQIGDENVHLVRNLMDEVFGPENFVSLVSFATTSGFTQAAALGRNGDYILWYAKDGEKLKSRRLWVKADGRATYRWLQFEDGTSRGVLKSDDGQIPEGARLYSPGDLQSQGAADGSQDFEFGGQVYRPGANSHWKASFPEGMRRLAWADRIHQAKSSIRYRRFADDFPWQARTNFWTDTGTGNFTDDKFYVVQTNTKVVERCMLLATDPGDLVLDPTCGSGTSAYVAEQWGRRWITIDTSRVALALARQRLMGSRFPYYLLADSTDGRAKESEVTQQPPVTGPVTDDIRHGFVYERAQHITLKSIANNPDIKAGMTREQVDAAIKKHAEFEFLYDKPYEDKKTVRVAGRFTVESLSPHRALAFDETADPSSRESISEQIASEQPDGQAFEQTILENLSQAGIQNGRRAERITFSHVQPFAGSYVQALGERTVAVDSDDPPTRVAIAVGPQYGTVDGAFIKSAVKEAIQADVDMLDLVCVLGFAFDPQATGITSDDGVTIETSDLGFVAAERDIGRVKVLMVRMNSELLMGEELKKTGAGNLFTVFGAPDIDLEPVASDDGPTFVAHLRGVDVYDPSTDDVRSAGIDQVALWMIDTDYDEESFFVRHCYFTGGNDPYKRLKTALKADIDPDAWDTLYRTSSRPFPAPSTGKVAIKVINDYGDEVMKVLEVG